MRKSVIQVAALAVLLAGSGSCARRESRSAIQRAIEEHLRQRPNLVMSNMSLDLREVKVNGDTAQAEVRFESKESPELAVNIHYVLRKAGGHWEVTSSSPAGESGPGPHGAAGSEVHTTAPGTGASPSSPPPQPSH